MRWAVLFARCARSATCDTPSSAPPLPWKAFSTATALPTLVSSRDASAWLGGACSTSPEMDSRVFAESAVTFTSLLAWRVVTLGQRAHYVNVLALSYLL